MENVKAVVNGVNVVATAKITFTKKNQNPKREGSKARDRFAKYMGSKTVAEYLDKEGTKTDLKYDWEHGFIDIEGIERETVKS